MFYNDQRYQKLSQVMASPFDGKSVLYPGVLLHLPCAKGDKKTPFTTHDSSFQNVSIP
jgi:hypothetical protein